MCLSVLRGYYCLINNPERQKELLIGRVGHYQDWHKHPLGYMITLALSIRARDENTKKTAIAFLEKHPTRKDMIKLNIEEISAFLKKARFGMYNRKAEILFDIIQN